ncbi:MAG: hypothetical protein PW792_10790 [Acidobacteriaceae bacterium]|nr:hypothetical protein [Acidobacteriaceae bacterium]
MFRLLRNYFWWTYERGSLHYDVMVTVILAFLFIAPHYIDFRDKPAPPVVLGPREVKVTGARDNDNFMVFEVRAADLEDANTDQERVEAMQHIILPIAGPVHVQRVSAVLDTHGKTVAWDATVSR